MIIKRNSKFKTSNWSSVSIWQLIKSLRKKFYSIFYLLAVLNINLKKNKNYFRCSHIDVFTIWMNKWDRPTWVISRVIVSMVWKEALSKGLLTNSKLCFWALYSRRRGRLYTAAKAKTTAIIFLALWMVQKLRDLSGKWMAMKRSMDMARWSHTVLTWNMIASGYTKGYITG